MNWALRSRAANTLRPNLASLQKLELSEVTEREAKLARYRGGGHVERRLGVHGDRRQWRRRWRQRWGLDTAVAPVVRCLLAGERTHPTLEMARSAGDGPPAILRRLRVLP